MKKRVNYDVMVEYITKNLNRECNANLTHSQTERMLSVIQDCIESMTTECYSFKLFNINFNAVEKKGRLYKSVVTDKVEYAPPYYKLEIKPSVKFQNKLKEVTRHYTDDIPLKAGLTDDEYDKALNEWREKYL